MSYYWLGMLAFYGQNGTGSVPSYTLDKFTVHRPSPLAGAPSEEILNLFGIYKW